MLFLILGILVNTQTTTVIEAAGYSSPSCHEGQYEAFLKEEGDEEQNGAHLAAERTARAAARMRLGCATAAHGDDRASFLDDFAGQMESAAGFAESARDFAGGCSAMHKDIDTLRGALSENHFSAIWTKTLKSRIEGAAIYRGMCDPNI